MEKEIILNAFKVAIRELYKNDYYLIENETAERSIVSTLKCYLKETWIFNSYKIDVEYNREWENRDPKRDYNWNATTADLVIHKTRWDTIYWNLVYLESKTFYNANEYNINKDKESIICFLNKFKYEYWIFLFLWKDLSKTYLEVIKLWEWIFDKKDLFDNK